MSKIRKSTLPIFLRVCLSHVPTFHVKCSSLQGVVAFHAGTVHKDDRTLTCGGRVIAVSAFAPTLREALDLVYSGVDKISFEGKVFRRDIAHRFVSVIRIPYSYI